MANVNPEEKKSFLELARCAEEIEKIVEGEKKALFVCASNKGNIRGSEELLPCLCFFCFIFGFFGFRKRWEKVKCNRLRKFCHYFPFGVLVGE